MVDEVRLDPLAAVCDRGVGGGELHRRDRDALPDRYRADRRSRPVGGQEAAGLAGEVDPGAAAEPEARHPLLQAALAEVALGDEVGPDVRRALEDLLDLQRLGPVRLGVVDHAVRDLEGAGNLELRVRRDVVLRERAADGHDLEHRARLEDVAHRMVEGETVRRRGRVAVRVVARLLRHPEDRARARVEDDGRRVLRVPLAHRLLEHLLGVRLDMAVEREIDVTAVVSRAILDRVDGLAERVPHLRRPTRRPLQLLVQLELEPREAGVVRAREAEYRRRDRSLRIDALLVGLEREADEVALHEPGREPRRRLPLDVDETAAAVGELPVQGPDRNSQYLRRDPRLAAWIGDLHRIGVDVGRLLTDREWIPQPVVDRPSCGRQGDRLLRLRLRHRGERRGPHGLEPSRARAEGREREEDDEEEKAEPRVDDPRLQRRPAVRSR